MWQQFTDAAYRMGRQSLEHVRAVPRARARRKCAQVQNGMVLGSALVSAVNSHDHWMVYEGPATGGAQRRVIEFLREFMR